MQIKGGNKTPVALNRIIDLNSKVEEARLAGICQKETVIANK